MYCLSLYLCLSPETSLTTKPTKRAVRGLRSWSHAGVCWLCSSRSASAGCHMPLWLLWICETSCPCLCIYGPPFWLMHTALSHGSSTGESTECSFVGMCNFTINEHENNHSRGNFAMQGLHVSHNCFTTLTVIWSAYNMAPYLAILLVSDVTFVWDMTFTYISPRVLLSNHMLFITKHHWLGRFF